MSGGQDQAAEAINTAQPDRISELQRNPKGIVCPTCNRPMSYGGWQSGSWRWSPGEDPVPEPVARMLDEKFRSNVNERLATLAVDIACLRARVESLEGRASKVAAPRPPVKLAFGPAVQFELNGRWRVGNVVVFENDPLKGPSDGDQVFVSSLDGLWQVPKSMLTKKPLRND